jgi:hypothetical protein
MKFSAQFIGTKNYLLYLLHRRCIKSGTQKKLSPKITINKKRERQLFLQYQLFHLGTTLTTIESMD